MHLVRLLLKGPKDAVKVIEHLKQQFHLEQEVIAKIGNLKTFHAMFLALVRGQHIIRQMDAKEKKLLRNMQQILGKAVTEECDEDLFRKMLSGEWKKDVMKAWVLLVYNAIEEKIDECIADGTIDGHHRYVDFELVNNPAFVGLCRDCYKQLMKRQVNESLLNVFVHIFREWFNTRD
jgi:hypothetical protein